MAPPAIAIDDQRNLLSTSRIIIVFLAVATISFFVRIDETSVAVALPRIGSDLNADKQVVWIATGRFITATAFQLVYGRLADIWSRKAVIMAAIVIFVMGSLGSSLSNDLISMVVSRAVGGIGGGGLATVSQVIVSDVVTLRQRGKYQGILGASVALGNGVGPLIGGLFSDKASWRWIFRLNLILGGFAFVVIFMVIPSKPPSGNWKEKLRKVDFVGSFLVLAACTLVILALTWGGAQYAWSSVPVLLPLFFGVAVAAAFIFWQAKGARLPSLPLYIFKQKMVCGACLTHTINGWCALVQAYYLPTFYQILYGYSATKSGALLIPVTVVGSLASTASGLLITWTGRYREIILSGWIMWTIGLGLLASLDENSGLGKQIGYSLLTGLGIGQTFQPALIAIQASVERKDISVASGARNLVRSLGGTIGLAVSGSILNNILRSRLQSLPPALIEEITSDLLSSLETLEDASTKALVRSAYQQGFRVMFIINAALGALAFVLAFCLMEQVDLDKKDAEDERVVQEGDEEKTATGRLDGQSDRNSDKAQSEESNAVDVQQASPPPTSKP